MRPKIYNSPFVKIATLWTSVDQNKLHRFSRLVYYFTLKALYYALFASAENLRQNFEKICSVQTL
jgi:hypothetical protein